MSDLIGAELDAAVARAMGATDVTLEDWGDGVLMCITAEFAFEKVPFQPSTKWSDGGPIILAERIAIIPADRGTEWFGQILRQRLRRIGREKRPGCDCFGEYGPTPLIAAMRAFVASRGGCAL